MPEIVPKPNQEIEQPELTANPADILSYWDVQVPEFIDQYLDYGQSLAEPTKWSAELKKSADYMKQSARKYSPVMRQTTWELASPVGVGEPESFMGNVDKWYRRLGPTNNLSEAAEYIIPIYEKLKKSEVSDDKTAEKSLLQGVLLHDLGLAVNDSRAKKVLLTRAKQEYVDVMHTEHRWSDHNRRDASRFLMDITFEQLFVSKEAGEIDYTEFENKYMALQREQASQLIEMGRPEYRVPTGELFERYAVLLTRHAAWSDEVHDETKVRNAMPREDRAMFPWHPNQGLYWSYDMVVDTSQGSSLIQLKSEDMTHDLEGTHYLPAVTVFTNNVSDIRHKIAPIAEALYRVYSDFDSQTSAEQDDNIIGNASKRFNRLVKSN